MYMTLYSYLFHVLFPCVAVRFAINQNLFNGIPYVSAGLITVTQHANFLLEKFVNYGCNWCVQK